MKIKYSAASQMSEYRSVKAASVVSVKLDTGYCTELAGFNIHTHLKIIGKSSPLTEKSVLFHS